MVKAVAFENRLVLAISFGWTPGDRNANCVVEILNVSTKTFGKV